MNWKTPGHKRQKINLEKLLKNPSHAYLFSGPKGIGKLDLAKEFAKEILGNGKDSLKNHDLLILDKLWIEDCNEAEILQSSNFDQQHRKKKKPKPKTDTISIDDIHKIIEIINQTGVGNKKVVILRDIERMNRNAANAFLKTLEEPAKDTFFICTTSNKDLLLETIKSRVQEIEFGFLNEDEIVQFLKSQEINSKEISEEILKEFAHYSFGQIQIAKAFLENTDKLEEVKNSFEKITNFFNSPSKLEGVKKAGRLFGNPDELKKEIENWTNFLQIKIKGGDKKAAQAFQNLLVLNFDLKSNVNKKLALENFYFRI